MKKLFVILALTLAALAQAQDKVTVTGYLMDKSCADTKTEARTHDKGCLEMADCIRSGYGVVTPEGKFLAFDAKGNKDAAAWIKTTKKKTEITVTVTGTMDKDVLKVASIK
jgi:hypothetical protein